MQPPADLQDRRAARLLGVPVDAGVVQIRGRFRQLVKAVHPDRSVGDACVDLGRLSEAKDHLIARAERIEQHRARREREAARRLEAMRAAPAPDRFPSPIRRVSDRDVRARFEDHGRLGRLIDLAG